MEISQVGLDLIKKYESFSAKEYLCPAGYRTIGYGHVILPSEKFGILNLKEAEVLLKKDVLVATRWINKRVEVPIGQNQFDALCSFVFNVGVGNFTESTLLKRLNQCNYLEAAKEFDKWVFAKGKKLNGLVKRRQEEKELFLKAF